MLEVNGLRTYYGRARILEDVSFQVARGEVVALLGRNGAGKTTTLKSIMSLLRPAAGKVIFDGREISGLAPYQIARLGLGYVPEDRRIFTNLSVIENLAAGHQRPRDDAPVWTPDRLFALFPNLAQMRHRLGGSMSGGEQQMLTIARTLMGNPRAILMDEPSEGLAPVIVEQMVETIAELKAHGVTIVLSEQNLHFARAVADRATIIEKGRIRYTGSMEDLAADEEVRAAYLTV
jgi:branched-chain amino acid transport system ATP-binding protein